MSWNLRCQSSVSAFSPSSPSSPSRIFTKNSCFRLFRLFGAVTLAHNARLRAIPSFHYISSPRVAGACAGTAPFRRSVHKLTSKVFCVAIPRQYMSPAPPAPTHMQKTSFSKQATQKVPGGGRHIVPKAAFRNLEEGGKRGGLDLPPAACGGK